MLGEALYSGSHLAEMANVAADRRAFETPIWAGRWRNCGSPVTCWNPVSWPPVDIVLIDEVTGETVNTWHEGGDAALLLTAVLNEDLPAMTLDDLVEKWDLGMGVTTR